MIFVSEGVCGREVDGTDKRLCSLAGVVISRFESSGFGTRELISKDES